MPGKTNVLDGVSLVFIGYNPARFIQIAEGLNTFKEPFKGIMAPLMLKRAYFKAIQALEKYKHGKRTALDYIRNYQPDNN